MKIQTKTVEEFFIKVMEGVDPFFLLKLWRELFPFSEEDIQKITENKEKYQPIQKITENKEKYQPPCNLDDNLDNLIILYKIDPGLFIQWKWGGSWLRFVKTGHLLPDMLKYDQYFIKTIKSDNQLYRMKPYIFIVDLFEGKSHPYQPQSYASRRTMQVLQVHTKKECPVCHREFNPRRKNQIYCTKHCKRKKK